jgi:large repetitive protein
MNKKILKHVSYLLLLVQFVFIEQTLSQCIANAGPDVTLCAGSSVALGGAPSASGANAPFTYNWSPAVDLSCTDCPNPTTTTNQTRTYTLTIYNADSSCVVTDQVVVTFSALPVASYTVTGANNCASIPVIFTGTTPGVGNVYNWNFGNPASNEANTATGPFVGHAFTAHGNGTESFTVTLTVTNAAGCTSLPVTQNVTVNQTPGAALMDPITDFRNCGGSDFDLFIMDASTLNPASNYQIIWGDGSPNFSNTSFPGGGLTHTYTTQNVFDMQYIVTGQNGCSDTLFQTVTNITNPAIGAANPGATQGCGPIEICFPLTNFGINHPTTIYIIDYGDGSPIDTLSHPPPNTLCHTYLNSSCPGSYTFVASAENLCDVSSATITPIRVYLPPTPSFTATPNPACVGTPITFLNTTNPGFNANCGTFATYTWDFGDGSPLVTVSGLVPVNQIHTYNAPGNYTVTLTASNVTCGSNTYQQVVCIEVPPLPNFTVPNNSACIPFTRTVTNTTTTLNTCNVIYSWNVIYNGSTCQPSAGTWDFANGTNASSTNPSFQFSSPGEYIIRLTTVNSCGVFTHDETIFAQGPPIVSVNPLSSICSGQTASPFGAVNDCYEPANTYSWTFQNGSPASANTLDPGTITFNNAGDRIVTLTVTNNCGSSNASTTITVNDLPPAVNPTANTPLCEGSTLNLSSNLVDGATYTWSGPNGFSSGQQNPQITNVTSANQGTYSVFATAGVCQGPSQNVNVVINPAPTVTVPTNITRCLNGSNANLAGTPAGGTWSGTGVSAAGVFNPSNAGVGTHVLTYTYTNAQGCSNSATLTATVNPLPTVNAGSDLSVCNQPIPVDLTATPAGGTWTGTGITDPSGEFTPSGLGNFNAIYTFTDANGCIGRDTVVISVINATAGNAGNDSTVCLNAPLVQLNGLPAGGAWSGTGLIGNSFNPNAAGTFELVYSFGSGSCATTDTLEIIVNPLPTINPLSNITTCSNGSIINLTATPAGGTWSGNGVVGNTFNPALANVGNQTLTYTFTSPVNWLCKYCNIDGYSKFKYGCKRGS